VSSWPESAIYTRVSQDSLWFSGSQARAEPARALGTGRASVAYRGGAALDFRVDLDGRTAAVELPKDCDFLVHLRDSLAGVSFAGSSSSLSSP
jgi:hypothetical protein